MSDTAQQSITVARRQLQSHFSHFSEDRYGDGWSKLWDQGDFLPWDRGFPSPALDETLAKRHDLIGNALKEVDGRQVRKRALVPGCGRGVDVLLLESFGYHAVGLEISEAAVTACEKYAKEHGSEYPTRDKDVGRGTATFVHGDFYQDDWLEKIGIPGEKFDLVYDYTFFCAMRPSMRPAWALRMSRLLGPSPQANLICLEFPTQKSSLLGGPPFSSPPSAYMEHLSHPGENISYDAEGNVESNPLTPATENGLERVAHWQPERTHKIGMDEHGNVRDYVAVWRHR